MILLHTVKIASSYYIETHIFIDLKATGKILCWCKWNTRKAVLVEM